MNQRVILPLLGLVLALVLVTAVYLALRDAQPGPPGPSMSAAPPTPAQREADLRARRLAPDQRCVSGTVVTVRPGYAVQMVRDGRIVHCKGRLADIPIR